jgi:nitrate reductase gamma subunit
MASVFDGIIFGVLPYIMLVSFFGVQTYRWLVNRFSWTAKSSQLFERRALGIAAIPLHYAVIVLLIAHILGILSGYFGAGYLILFDTIATIAAPIFIYGVLVALVRRIVVREVRAMSTAEDYIILLFLLAIPIIGLYNRYVLGIFGVFPLVARWFTSIFIGKVDEYIGLMATLPILNKIHILLALIFLTYWPFTKMAGMLSFPITYAWRRYQVIRQYRRVSR